MVKGQQHKKMPAKSGRPTKESKGGQPTQKAERAAAVHPGVTRNCPRQTSYLEAYRAEIFFAHEGSRGEGNSRMS